MADKDPIPGLCCPVCGATGSSIFYDTVSSAVREYRFDRCQACQSLFDVEPDQLDYATHTEDENAIRDYVEMNAAVDIIGANVLAAIARRPQGRMLDIGCGFGFGADVARRLAGWNVIGVEPSTYGKRGAAELGLRMYHEIIDSSHELAKERFDAVFSSEVIEHVPDPIGFIQLTRSMLSPDGLLVIGTPDAASLDGPISPAERLAVYSPGAHRFLLSRSAFHDMLSNAGFTYIHIETRGTSMVAYASNSPIELSDVSPIQVGYDYTSLVLRDEPVSEMLRSGMTFRKFRYLIDLGRLEEAATMLPLLEPVQLSADNDITSWLDFMDCYAANAAVSVYYRAILQLNHFSNFRRASDLFEIAFKLCEAKIRVAPALAVVETSLLWGCIYHAALARKLDGDPATARAYWTRLLDPEADNLPSVSSMWSGWAKDRLAE